MEKRNCEVEVVRKIEFAASLAKFLKITNKIQTNWVVGSPPQTKSGLRFQEL
jgi:hypothetical protein